MADARKPRKPGTYLVERYWPMRDETLLHEMLVRLRAAADAMQDAGDPVRYVGSVVVPDDELVLSLLDARSIDAARAASEAAGVPFERIVPASAVGFDGQHDGLRPSGPPVQEP